jgi:hypothetical protein
LLTAQEEDGSIAPLRALRRRSRTFALHGVGLSFALVAASFVAAAEDVIRCASNRLVNVGMIAAEVIARCGQPKSRSVEGVPVRARTRNGNVVVTGSSRVERWTYDRGQGQFDALLTFDGDKLVRIDLLTAQ